MSINKLAAAAIGLGFLSYASAGLAANEGPFIGIMGGANWSGDQDISGTGVGINRTVDTDTGWAVLPVIGYRYGNGFRTELEIGYRRNDMDSISGGTTGAPVGFASVNGSGKVTAKTAMVNLLYDLNMNGRFSPYFGGGVGYAKIDYDHVRPVGVVGAVPGQLDDNDGVFAYQGMAGVSYAMNDNMELAAEYRYFAAKDQDMRTSGGVGVETEYDSHAALIGLRIGFGAPKAPVVQPVAAAPEPAPAPAPVDDEPAALPRSFMVFFDWDRSDVTAEADAILNDAAAYAKTTGAVRIGATGHADRSGTDEYNMALSMRRANAVKARLLALGVPESEISIDAKGEREPLVPTDDGVREPQNRRVEIVLQ